MKSWICAILGVIGLGGCSSADVARYRAEQPTLTLESYFNGTLDAWGMFQDRSGEVVKRFHAHMEASWKGNIGTLDEHFTYNDGTTQRRVWTITAHGDGRYTGRADDVVGEAEGQAAGNAFHWRYVLTLPVGDSEYDVTLDDWMYLMNDEVMLNRTVMKKFGFRVGEVTISFFKRKADQ